MPAPATLTEFISYTCPHCAHFEKEAAGELTIGFIRTGKGSMEYRPFLRNIVDEAVLADETGVDFIGLGDKLIDVCRRLG